MQSSLTVLSLLFWWVIYASLGAIVPALISSLVLRWHERSAVVFNRVYLACLLWTLAGLLMLFLIAVHEGHTRPPYAPLLASTSLRWAILIDMLVGVIALWRLVPRADARHIRPTSACMAVALVTAIGFGVATSLAG